MFGSFEFKDHVLRVKVSGKVIATFDNVKITTFKLDTKHTLLYFNVLAHGQSRGALDDLADVLDHGVRLEFKRAKHWSAQDDLLSDEEDETEESTEQQEELGRIEH